MTRRRSWLVVTLMLGLGITLAQAQGEPEIAWERLHGGPMADVIRGAVLLPDGGIATAGYARPSADENYDVQFMRVDRGGELLAMSYFGQTNVEHGKAICAATDGGFIIGGYSYSFGNTRQMLLLKTDHWGNMEWFQTMGQPGWDSAFDLYSLSTGRVIVAGDTQADLESTERGWLLCYNNAGDELWNVIVPDDMPARLFAVTRLTDGTFVAGGQAVPGGGTFTDLYFVGFTEDGDILWQTTHGGEGTEICRQVRALPDGGFVATGESSTGTGGDTDAIVAEFTATGELVWATTIGNNGDDYGRPLAVSRYGDIFAGGSVATQNNADQFFLAKLDRRGKIRWSTVYGQNGNDIAQVVLEVGLNAYQLMGERYGGGPDGGQAYFGLIHDGVYNASVGDASGDAAGESQLRSADGRLSSRRLSGAGSAPQTIELASVYPNPFNSSARVAVRLPASDQASVTVVDLLGRTLTRLQQGPAPAGEYQYTVHADHLPSGRYYLVVAADGYASTAQPFTVVK